VTGRRLLVVLVLLLALPRPAAAYLDLSAQVGDQVVRLRWGDTPRWYATNRGVAGVTASDFQAAAARAFATWEAVPTASIAFQFAGFVGVGPDTDDGLSVLGFEPHPEMDRVLGATGFVIDAITGEIVESDIFFNSAFSWTVSATGDASGFDLQSVATHEIGHFLGLGHSALGETEVRPDGGRRVLATGAVMFPISFGRGIVADRTLQPDDIAGVSDLYPDGNFRASTGAVRGRVLRNGQPVFGAHVVAFNPRTGTLIGGFSIGDGGGFQIVGLTPGPHVIRVEPLDDADVESFFDESSVDVDFAVTFYPRLFVAPIGGVGEHIDVTVSPK
jgi:hypothetical protein